MIISLVFMEMDHIGQVLLMEGKIRKLSVLVKACYYILDFVLLIFYSSIDLHLKMILVFKL